MKNEKKVKVKEKNSEFEGVNEVFLVGRVTSIAGEKKLPSGDFVSEFRIVVDRPGKAGAIDTIDIAVWKSALRKRVATLKPEVWVEINGSVRRRFWQSAAGVASRWQVEASEIRKL
jgi:single-strand DNA-binding protein